MAADFTRARLSKLPPPPPQPAMRREPYPLGLPTAGVDGRYASLGDFSLWRRGVGRRRHEGQFEENHAVFLTWTMIVC